MQPRLLHEPLRLAGASLLRLQSDARLVVLARDGHDPAFTAIVDRYRAPLVRYCTRLLGPERAEDAVQQTLINAHTAMNDDLDRDIQLRPWLYRIAHNVSLNVLRGARETTPLTDDRADTVVVEDVVAQREELRNALAAIEALPEPQRDALLLRELEGRSHEEIAAALGVSVGGARQHLYRARTAVRGAMTAITPYPLLARLLDLGGQTAAETGAARASEVAVGTGLGAVATKVGVGVVAAGAVAAGAFHADHRHHHKAHSHTAPAAVVVHHAISTPVVPAGAAAGAAAASLRSSSSGRGSGTSGSATEHRHHGSSSHSETTHRHHGAQDLGRRPRRVRHAIRVRQRRVGRWRGSRARRRNGGGSSGTSGHQQSGGSGHTSGDDGHGSGSSGSGSSGGHGGGSGTSGHGSSGSGSLAAVTTAPRTRRPIQRAAGIVERRRRRWRRRIAAVQQR